VIKAFAERPFKNTNLIIVTKDMKSPYSGMIPGWIAGHYTFDECHIDLAPLAEWANAKIYHTSCNGIDRNKKLVFMKDYDPVKYDFLSIDIGINPKMLMSPHPRITPVKPISEFGTSFNKLLNRVKNSEILD